MSIRMAPKMARLTVLGKGWNDNTVIESGDGFIVDEEIWGEDDEIWGGDEFRFTVRTGVVFSEAEILFRFRGRITVDWGDGTIDDGNAPSSKPTVNSYTLATHFYAETRTEYTISITGDLQDISFCPTSDFPGYAGECYRRVTAVLTPFPATMRDVADFNELFLGSSILTGIPANLFDNCPNVTSLSSAFELCASLTDIPAGLFDNCKNVTDFRGVFSGCQNLTSIPTGLFDNCPNVTSFKRTFRRCTNLASIPAGLFDNCKNVTDFSYTFYDCQQFTGVLPELWNTHPSANGEDCFYNCRRAANYESVPVEWGWD